MTYLDFRLFFIGLLIKKPVFRKTIADQNKNQGQKNARSTNWNRFLLDLLEERETLYTINFTKIYQKVFFIFKMNKMEHHNLSNEHQNGNFQV